MAWIWRQYKPGLWWCDTIFFFWYNYTLFSFEDFCVSWRLRGQDNTKWCFPPPLHLLCYLTDLSKSYDMTSALVCMNLAKKNKKQSGVIPQALDSLLLLRWSSTSCEFDCSCYNLCTITTITYVLFSDNSYFKQICEEHNKSHYLGYSSQILEVQRFPEILRIRHCVQHHTAWIQTSIIRTQIKFYLYN